nr:hypothetical protein [Streptomyces harenosi]
MASFPPLRPRPSNAMRVQPVDLDRDPDPAGPAGRPVRLLGRIWP